MTAWRLELTVLTDLSASIFAVCFLVLLIFIAHAGSTAPARLPATPPVSIDAGQRFRLVERRPGGSSEMVEMLFRHGKTGGESGPVRSGAGIGIDLFEDRIEIRTPETGTTTVLAADAIERRFASATGAIDEPIRLYVFSNTLYAPTLAALAMPASSRQEMSVPRALRDPADETHGWSEAFLALGAERLDESGFRRRLAVLLDGSAQQTRRAGSAEREDRGVAGGRETGGETEPASLSDFWALQFDAFARRLALLMPIVGGLAALWIRLHAGGVRPADADAALRLPKSSYPTLP